jgi:hypothetical protein
MGAIGEINACNRPMGAIGRINACMNAHGHDRPDQRLYERPWARSAGSTPVGAPMRA